MSDMSRVKIEDDWFSVDGLDFQRRPDGSLVVAAMGEYEWTLTASEVVELVAYIAL